MKINSIDMQFHQTGNFREQLAVLYMDGIHANTHVKVIRSYISVGLPGSVGFDNNDNGWGSTEMWNKVDNMIEKEGVCGVFHTHPTGFDTFSSLDWQTMIAFAKTYGKRYLWYGIQEVSSNHEQWVCLNMLSHKVFRYHFDFNSSVNDKVLLLPLPPRVKVHEDCFDISM